MTGIIIVVMIRKYYLLLVIIAYKINRETTGGYRNI